MLVHSELTVCNLLNGLVIQLQLYYLANNINLLELALPIFAPVVD